MPWKNITKVQQRDTCLALTFLLLLIWLFTKQTAFVYAAMGLLLLGMLIPAAMSPLAWLWFGLSHALGKVTSSILLTAVYALILLPVAFVRQLLGKDSLHLRHWKKSDKSCFRNRNHVFTPEDFNNPY